MPPTTTLVIPCFNEAARLREEAFLSLAAGEGLRLLFVDDGSTDATAERLEALVAGSAGKADMIRLSRNSGKAEAVRRGMLAAMEGGALQVGFTDADLATPPEELIRLSGELAGHHVNVVMGSRVLLLGTDIRRNPTRHYLGRVFATCASLALDLAVYDTQCGAKFFRVTPLLRHVLHLPFESRWAFDVELMARLLAPGDHPPYRPRDFMEVPLKTWHDMGGSKVTLWGGLRAFADLLRIGISMRRRRAGNRTAHSNGVRP